MIYLIELMIDLIVLMIYLIVLNDHGRTAGAPHGGLCHLDWSG